MGVITDLCERLADVYALQGVDVRANLKPGISRAEVIEALAPLRLVVPEDVIELYAWRNGHLRPNDDRVLSFRDTPLLSMDGVVDAYLTMQHGYGGLFTLEDARVDLKAVIPIASFHGAWDVVACGAHLHGGHLDYPVIHVHQGISLYYHSIESMLRTAIDWVASPHFVHHCGLPASVEMEIWERHNPGVRASWMEGE